MQWDRRQKKVSHFKCSTVGSWNFFSISKHLHLNSNLKPILGGRGGGMTPPPPVFLRRAVKAIEIFEYLPIRVDQVRSMHALGTAWILFYYQNRINLTISVKLSTDFWDAFWPFFWRIDLFHNFSAFFLLWGKFRHMGINKGGKFARRHYYIVRLCNS